MDTALTELRRSRHAGRPLRADGLSEQFGGGAAEKANAFNSQIYALYYDKANPDSDASRMVHGLLDPYVYDESLFNASIVVEVDSLTGQVYSAFYDTASDKLRFASDDGADGAMLIDDRSATAAVIRWWATTRPRHRQRGGPGPNPPERSKTRSSSTTRP